MTEQLIWFGIAEFFFSISPGPAVFLVISLALRRGFAAGAAASLGIIAVNLLYFGLSAVGVGAVLVASPRLFLALKIIGAAYLVYTAIGILRDLWREAQANARGAPLPAQVSANGARGERHAGAFLKGVAIQASSIKNIMLFLAIIPQFVVPEAGNVAVQFAALAVVSVLVELPILLAYAALSARLGQSVRSLSVRRALDGLSAVVLLGIAGSILFTA